ncbi:MBL fold metallo-hydrolase [Candidatus Sodalis pierantonius]|uniref:MBL fold metallo-hydrolase n=1 Tax=Candidatus Sodalis pierantonii TaxID=1486991 RepID=UPI002FF95DAB
MARGRYGQGGNPSLHGLAPEHIYLSHSHEDHIGGLASVRRVWQAVPVSSSFRAPGHGLCLRGQR